MFFAPGVGSGAQLRGWRLLDPSVVGVTTALWVSAYGLVLIGYEHALWPGRPRSSGCQCRMTDAFRA